MSAIAEVTAAVTALREGLEEQRQALLRGDADRLEEARRVLELALRHGAVLRAALKDKTLPPASASERAELEQGAQGLKSAAHANAKLLVRSRDLTQGLLAELQTARPSLDAKA